MFERGPYGIEWTEHKDEEPSVFGRVVLVVVVVALVSLAATIVRRIRADRAELEATRQEERAAKAVLPDGPSQASSPTNAAALPPPVQPPPVSRMEKRPPKVRNLLMRLEEAEKARDVEMAVTTIETLRALPGAPAADLDNALARRLGTLNMRRLFELKCAQWVETVVVKRGDSATRIASERGATLASLKRLNGNVEKLKIGQKLVVLNHPRFNLVVHRRSRTADLQLNGKFFKRYDLTTAEGLKDGAFEWRELSLQMKASDRAELDMMLPKATSVLVSEM